MNAINSPYNFVALPRDRTAPPAFPHRDTADLPSRDGLSGWMDIEFEATTPIYVRGPGDHSGYRASRFSADCLRLWNASNRSQPASRALYSGDDFREFREFVRFYTLPDGRCAIPGTSIRGVLRSLVEIISGSRIHPVSKRRYAVRDLRNRDLYTNWFTSGDQRSGFKPKVAAGWLVKDPSKPGCYTLIPCRFARVEQEDLERLAKGRVYLGKEDLTPAGKYSLWRDARQPLTLRFRIDQEKVHPHSQPLVYAKAVPADLGRGEGALIEGTLVFTGQPMERDRNPRQPGRKHMEFVFHSESPERAVEVPSRLVEEMVQTHSDEMGEPREALQYWKPLLAKGERVPVFYLAFPPGITPSASAAPVDLTQKNGQLHSLGLALMYRFPYRKRMCDAVPRPHRDFSKPDFAETLFGYQREDTPNDGLRGRVSFGPAVCDNPDISPLPAVLTVLGGPKPTYYPNYITQTNEAAPGRLSRVGAYKTLMDEAAIMRGWKVYPSRHDGFTPQPPLPPEVRQTPNFDTATAFEPLPAGARFLCRMRFHNLRPEELGALVWAVTWGGNPGCRHRIGMAKPYGYGCAKARIAAHRFIPNNRSAEPLTPEKTRDLFEDWMRQNQPGWLDGPEIQADLIGMTRHDHGQEHTLLYPVLSMGGRNEFAEAKGSSRDNRHSLFLPLWRHIASGGAKRPSHPAAFSPRANPVQPARPAPAIKPPPPSQPSAPPPPPQPREFKKAQVEITGCKERPGREPLWKGRIVDGAPVQCGSIVGPVPRDIAAGKIYTLLVKGEAANNYQFEFPPETS